MGSLLDRPDFDKPTQNADSPVFLYGLVGRVISGAGVLSSDHCSVFELETGPTPRPMSCSLQRRTRTPHAPEP
jgi:hypothetical protein